MSSIFSSIRSALSSYSYSLVEPSQLQSTVSHLSTRDREELVHDVALELNHEDVESSLADVERTLGECRESLGAFEKKERFLAVRIGRYRELMERREQRMRELSKMMQPMVQPSASPSDQVDDHSSDNEPVGDLESKSKHDIGEQLDTLESKHTADQESLRAVEVMHKDIVAQTETFRRKIEELEEKQQDLVAKRDECRDFLIAAAECT